MVVADVGSQSVTRSPLKCDTVLKPPTEAQVRGGGKLPTTSSFPWSERYRFVAVSLMVAPAKEGPFFGNFRLSILMAAPCAGFSILAVHRVATVLGEWLLQSISG